MGFSDTAERIDDPAALRDADRTGLLMHASMAGGLVRSISGALDSGALDHLRGARPRALVWITGRSDRPRHAAGVVTALAEATGHPSVPPIVVSRECPGWVGALDIALVSGDDAGDPALAEAIGAAARRGAELVLDLPEEGPARAAAGDRGVWLKRFRTCRPSADCSGMSPPVWRCWTSSGSRVWMSARPRTSSMRRFRPCRRNSRNPSIPRSCSRSRSPVATVSCGCTRTQRRQR